MTVSRRNAKSSPKIVSLDPELAVDVHAGEDRVEVALVAVEVDGDLLLGHAGDAAELVDEVHVPGGAAELAVGRRAAGRAPPASGRPRGSLRPRPRAGSAALIVARAKELGRAEQAADVVGAERAASLSGPWAVYTTGRESGRPRSARRGGGAARARELSSRELTGACLDRIGSATGRTATTATRARSTRGCGSTRTTRWLRPTRADERLAAGDAPLLCGVPIGLKDLYAVAGKPLTASSRVLDEVPERDCDAWARSAGRGDGAARPPAHARVRLRRDDRPGRQPLGARALGRRVERRLRRGARLEAGAGGDRHRHRRLAAHPLGRVRDVDDQADARAALDPRDRPARADLRPSRADGPRGADCEPLLAALAGVAPPAERRPLRRWARLAADRRARPRRRRRLRAGARRASGRAGRAAAPPARLDVLAEFFDLVLTEMLVWHRRFDDRRDDVPLLEPRPARARRAAGDDRRGVRRRPDPPRGGRRRLARLVRRAPDRRGRRADPADRRAGPRAAATRSRSATSTTSR